MPINETLARYSDWLYTTAAAIYVVALMFTLIEQGFGAKARLAMERRREKARELVGAGGPPIEDVQASQREVGRPERIGRMGAALLVLGCCSCRRSCCAGSPCTARHGATCTSTAWPSPSSR